MCEVTQSCPTLCDPMDCSLPGFSVLGIFQAIILEWIAIAEYIRQNTGLDEAQVEIRISKRNINSLRYADFTTLMAESEEELKSLLIIVKEESEKDVLKLNIQKTKIMMSGPITSWQIDGETGEIDRETGEIDGETVETVADFILGGSKITADDDCSHEIKRRLLLGRKVMTNLDSMFKSINSSVLSLLCALTPTSLHDY